MVQIDQGAGLIDPSAAGKPTSTLRVGRRVVELQVVVQARLISLGKLLVVLGNVGGVFDLRPGDGRLQAVRADLDSAERHEGQVAADEALLDGREPRLVRLDL